VEPEDLPGSILISCRGLRLAAIHARQPGLAFRGRNNNLRLQTQQAPSIMVLTLAYGF
jgi:hypothetical protein